MIYVFPPGDRPIRQGDIFADIPRASLSLDELTILRDADELQQVRWSSVAAEQGTIAAVLPVTAVYAIVATQDCDASTAVEITLCEILGFSQVEGKAKGVTSPDRLQKIITQHARINQKWFYLPADSEIGFSDRMAVDFRRTISIPRSDLEKFRQHRKGSLNPVARLHFRERLGQFFRRYAYNEWYPLTTEELSAYKKDHKWPVSPIYDWQRNK